MRRRASGFPEGSRATSKNLPSGSARKCAWPGTTRRSAADVVRAPGDDPSARPGRPGSTDNAVLSWLRRGSNRRGAQLTEQITVSVDPEVAEVYRSASDEVRRKLEVLVNLRLRDATLSRRALRDVMREVSRNAQRRGLTPEILQSILDEA